MAPFSLFNKTSDINGFYAMLIVNRLQILYFILILPMYLVHPYMILGIVIIGIFSQINLILFSKWFTSNFSGQGYSAFVQLFGERKFRFFVLFGLIPMLLKIIVLTLNYVEAIHQFIFPSMNMLWLVLAILLISFYVSSKGMENTIHFVVIAFLFSFWVILCFIPFFFPPFASLSDLYPLIPTSWSMNSWKSLLFLWSSFSGPEYLICISPWFKRGQTIFKYLTYGNLVSVVEFLISFISSLLFFGSNYLSKTNYPIVTMARYLQSPIIERIDMILLSLHMFHFVFIISFLILSFYGGIRIVFKRVHKQTTRIGFLACCAVIFTSIAVVNQWFWEPGIKDNLWLSLEIWSSSVTFLLVPALLLAAIKLKGRSLE
ncbi:GerAB/ArcD/ProY family transporter [Neobacillus terrae]|uniref:GerAB/ArcD/ProY family transporter n=1 Tax=Neobacillus terrae TaxID=3034837 RepID=UPI00140748B1|nr:GerAB/ArcD/ProY family transporter [Neobacillus terrae]NHM33253.1 GerAB/ArcD/ProY family transporter [Neobacillus terrae]